MIDAVFVVFLRVAQSKKELDSGHDARRIFPDLGMARLEM